MGAAKIKSFLAKLKAERYLVGQYLSGVLIKGDDAAAHSSLEAAGFPISAERELKFNRQQRFLEESIASRVAAVQKARAAEDEAKIEELLADAQRNARPIAGLGPPGTGKTTVVGSCVDKVLTDGGCVLYALPAAQQAARVRARRPEADVDTCAAAFYLWKQNADERMDVLEQYDLVVVDEVSQLDAQQFERILQMWAVADKMPALVFTGDFWAAARRQQQPSHGQPEVEDGLCRGLARDVALQLSGRSSTYCGRPSSWPISAAGGKPGPTRATPRRRR